jgi:hypothetical protein
LDIKATIDFMRHQPFVAADRTIVAGQSAGGWAALALSSLNPPGVSGMIDFASGRGGQQTLDNGSIGNCAPEALVWAAGKYGATARETRPELGIRKIIECKRAIPARICVISRRDVLPVDVKVSYVFCRTRRRIVKFCSFQSVKIESGRHGAGVSASISPK